MPRVRLKRSHVSKSEWFVFYEPCGHVLEVVSSDERPLFPDLAPCYTCQVIRLRSGTA